MKYEQHAKAEYAKIEHAKDWIDTKEGQDHLKICVKTCPYRLLKASKKAEAKGEEAKKETFEAKRLEDHLKICVQSCPYSPVKKGSPAKEVGDEKTGTAEELRTKSEESVGEKQ